MPGQAGQNPILLRVAQAAGNAGLAIRKHGRAGCVGRRGWTVAAGVELVQIGCIQHIREAGGIDHGAGRRNRRIEIADGSCGVVHGRVIFIAKAEREREPRRYSPLILPVQRIVRRRAIIPPEPANSIASRPAHLSGSLRTGRKRRITMFRGRRLDSRSYRGHKKQILPRYSTHCRQAC